eukprot:10039067-Alexandrium_andersonii.AAC.1
MPSFSRTPVMTIGPRSTHACPGRTSRFTCVRWLATQSLADLPTLHQALPRVAMAGSLAGAQESVGG